MATKQLSTMIFQSENKIGSGRKDVCESKMIQKWIENEAIMGFL
jgi:hypothetical protein